MGTNTKKEEGLRFKPYNDPSGTNKSVGYGINIDDPLGKKLIPKDVREGKRELTQQEADSSHDKRMQIADSDARNFVGADVYDKLDNERKGALKDMSYQMGGPTLSSFKKMREHIRSGNWPKASDELMNSRYGVKTPNRAKRNAAIMRGEQQSLEKEVLRQTKNGTRGR